jgi:hypothetical protein
MIDDDEQPVHLRASPPTNDDEMHPALAPAFDFPDITEVKKLLLLATIAVAAWFFIHDRPARWPGIPAGKDPAQSEFSGASPFQAGDYRITPLARYSVTAVVLSRERYRFDRAATLAPVDLALGWGPMSIASVINELRINQSGRWYHYTWRGDPPLSPESLAEHSANTHCLPASDEIRARLLAVRRHELVSLEGYLVEVSATDGFHWRSSLTRTDTGGGACELFWVTRVERRSLE